MIRALAGATPALVAVLLAAPAGAADVFRIRLTPVPIESSTRADVTGAGSAEAVLDGSRLTVRGSFAGLGGPATVARLHLGPMLGVRGPAIAELMVPSAAAGEFASELELDAAAIEALQTRRLYLQISSERAPDGNLWGWLLP